MKDSFTTPSSSDESAAANRGHRTLPRDAYPTICPFDGEGCNCDEGIGDELCDPPAAHTGFGDCACEDCFPVEPLTPLADHGRPLGLLRTLWVVLRGVRLYG